VGEGKPKNNQKFMKIIFKPEWKIRVRKNEKEEFLKRELAYKIIDLLKESDSAKAICINYHIIIRIALRPVKNKNKNNDTHTN
jgi:hypothetical protein